MSIDNRGKGYTSKFHAATIGHPNIPSGVWTQVQLNIIVLDLLNEFDEVVTYGFSPLKAGYYRIHGDITFAALPVGTEIRITIALGGGGIAAKFRLANNILFEAISVDILLWLNTGQIITLECYQNSGIAQALNPNVMQTDLWGYRIA